ncbi:outer membrane beta-barrel protein [Agarilytica rhodophyticola]|uniref:outer membrane beta-barrel protein n=1 Tax=Agarilytica rhodophyticola TaxID=1737490 RepID=UPI000B341021|nr:outer membrane beta-barrel protein [Agarilytica rhodophyticola]
MFVKRFLLPLMVSSAPLLCQQTMAGEAFIMPEVGRTEIKFKPDVVLPGFDTEVLGGAVGFVAGYKFDSNFFVGASHSFSSNDSFFETFDHYDLREFGFTAGYALHISEHFRIVPAVGFNSYTIDFDEGRLFNPGEEDSREIDGEDFYWRINVEIPFTELIQMNFAYIDGDYDFGDTSSLRVGLKLSF